MDPLTPTARSRVMAKIRQRDSDLEVRLRLAVWRAGLRYRKNVRVHGTPDLLISQAKIVVFVDSCFWHSCRFHCRRPKSNVRFWNAKLERNRQRDLAVTRYYRRRSWTVLRFWEHQLKTDFQGCVKKVIRAARP
ncbi:MAG: very short patch repair endonuclease [Acidobacteria bacterium]|nr:MAG: very short patch repair endonuclease [Acidobacteriota bacterium]